MTLTFWCNCRNAAFVMPDPLQDTLDSIYPDKVIREKIEIAAKEQNLPVTKDDLPNKQDSLLNIEAIMEQLQQQQHLAQGGNTLLQKKDEEIEILKQELKKLKTSIEKKNDEEQDKVVDQKLTKLLGLLAELETPSIQLEKPEEHEDSNEEKEINKPQEKEKEKTNETSINEIVESKEEPNQQEPNQIVIQVGEVAKKEKENKEETKEEEQIIENDKEYIPLIYGRCIVRSKLKNTIFYAGEDIKEANISILQCKFCTQVCALLSQETKQCILNPLLKLEGYNDQLSPEDRKLYSRWANIILKQTDEDKELGDALKEARSDTFDQNQTEIIELQKQLQDYIIREKIEMEGRIQAYIEREHARLKVLMDRSFQHERSILFLKYDRILRHSSQHVYPSDVIQPIVQSGYLPPVMTSPSHSPTSTNQLYLSSSPRSNSHFVGSPSPNPSLYNRSQSPMYSALHPNYGLSPNRRHSSSDISNL